MMVGGGPHLHVAWMIPSVKPYDDHRFLCTAALGCHGTQSSRSVEMSAIPSAVFEIRYVVHGSEEDIC